MPWKELIRYPNWKNVWQKVQSTRKKGVVKGGWDSEPSRGEAMRGKTRKSASNETENASYGLRYPALMCSSGNKVGLRETFVFFFFAVPLSQRRRKNSGGGGGGGKGPTQSHIQIGNISVTKTQTETDPKTNPFVTCPAGISLTTKDQHNLVKIPFVHGAWHTSPKEMKNADYENANYNLLCVTAAK